MALKVSTITGARQPLAPVSFVFVENGEERTEILRFHRRVLSPQFRKAIEAQIKKASKDKERKEEMVELLVLLDVQSPDILGADGKPENLTAAFWENVDDSLLNAVWQSHLESRESPNGQRPKTTKSTSEQTAS